MKYSLLWVAALSLFGMAVHAGEPPATGDQVSTSGAVTPIVDIPAPAKEAAATVDRFSTALAAGNIEAAARELDEQVLILESGGAERSLAEYLAGHAQADAGFLKEAHQQLLYRTARVYGDLAWVASESEIHVQINGAPKTILSTETMVLSRDATGWKIVHIHWSSRAKKT